jgi:alkanesulfonate monooxygenase SsuD/methylene tetrahydromethanopterin reductase-like flavin-dependent oxidoreductase (luciferase family)
MPEVGVFLVPSAEDPELTLRLASAADEGGLEYVSLQDHPYQRRFFDNRTLLTFPAARTRSIRLLTLVNLPLRPPRCLVA